MAMVFPLLASCGFVNESSSNSSSSLPGSSSSNSGTIDNEPRLDEINKILFGFNTTYSVKLWNAPASVVAEITNIIDDYSALADNYYEVPNINNVYSINKADGPIKIDERLFTLLEKSLEYAEILNGYFNPLMGKLSKLWKDSLHVETGPILPPQSTVDELLREVKSSKLVLDKENMTAEIIGNAEIDLGAVAKGYSLSLIKEALDKRDVTEYLINGGDSAILLGKKPGKTDFSVGMKDVPKAYFNSHDEIVSTSSMFVQGVEVNGIKYSHIINPFTGSAKTDFDLALAKGPMDGGLLDCMSTAFSVMNIDEIKAFESKYDLDIFIYDEGKIVYESKNMEVKYH